MPRYPIRPPRYSDHKRRSHSYQRSYRSSSPRPESRSASEEGAEQPRNTLLLNFQIADELVSKEKRKTNVLSGEIVDAKVLTISGLPGDLTATQLQNIINLLMHFLHLTTAPGFACVNISFTSDPEIINAEFRTIQETNNALSLDGLNLMNTTIHATRTKNYNGSETGYGAIDPNCLLELITGYKPSTYLDYIKQIGHQLMKKQQEWNRTGKSGSFLPSRRANEGVELLYNIDRCILLKNLPNELEEFEIRNICEPFGDIKGLYLLKQRGEFQGEAVVEYAKDVYYQMAMEGLDKLPLDPPAGQRLLEVSKPPPKWPAFPTAISTVSNPSPVLRIGNIISIEDIETEENYEALISDLLTGFNRFGKVLSYVLPRPNDGQLVCDGLGYIFVQYSSLFESANATRELRLQMYSDHQLHVDYYPEDLYLKKDYGQAGELI